MRHFHRKRGAKQTLEAAKVGTDPIENIANWANAQIVEERDSLDGRVTEALNLKTSEGRKRAYVGEYIVKIGQQFMIVEADKFEKEYSTTERPAKMSALEEENLYKPLISDPFEGMTRFNEGPKP